MDSEDRKKLRFEANMLANSTDPINQALGQQLLRKLEKEEPSTVQETAFEGPIEDKKRELLSRIEEQLDKMDAQDAEDEALQLSHEEALQMEFEKAFQQISGFPEILKEWASSDRSTQLVVKVTKLDRLGNLNVQIIEVALSDKEKESK